MELRVRNKLPDKDNWKTELQWIGFNRVKNEGVSGEEMWTNGFCQYTAVYFHIDQTHEATPEELKKAEEPFLQKKRERKQAKREDGKALIDQAFSLPVIPCNNPSGIVVFDVETTGLTPGDDEILQISAIDGDGNTLVNTYVRPYVKTDWHEASRINGITPKMVKDSPRAHEIIPLIRGIFDSAKMLVSYNGEFDMRFLQTWGLILSEKPHYDVMVEFAPIYGEWSDWLGDYKWQKLTTCARHYGYTFNAHDSLEDVRATLYCYRAMTAGENNENQT